MKRIITLDSDIVTANGPIYPKGCNGVLFRNVGDVPVLLMGFIPLPPGEKNDDFFYNMPEDILENQFDISFDSTAPGTNKAVLVVRKFNRQKNNDNKDC